MRIAPGVKVCSPERGCGRLPHRAMPISGGRDSVEPTPAVYAGLPVNRPVTGFFALRCNPRGEGDIVSPSSGLQA